MLGWYADTATSPYNIFRWVVTLFCHDSPNRIGLVLCHSRARASRPFSNQISNRIFHLSSIARSIPSKYDSPCQIYVKMIFDLNKCFVIQWHCILVPHLLRHNLHKFVHLPHTHTHTQISMFVDHSTTYHFYCVVWFTSDSGENRRRWFVVELFSPFTSTFPKQFQLLNRTHLGY